MIKYNTMTFGELKSKIERKLVESYKTKTFDRNIVEFKNLVLKNDTIAKVYHIYNLLSENKGYDKEFAKEFITECMITYTNIKGNLNLKPLVEWVSDVKCENKYKHIDIALSNKVSLIEERLKSRNKIAETLMVSPKEKLDYSLPLDQLVEIANKSIESYFENLTPEEISTVVELNKLNDNQIKERYYALKNLVKDKLVLIQEESTEDSELIGKINETIQKIETDDINAISLYKLQNFVKTL